MNISFRGKQVDSGEWYHGFYVRGRHGEHYILSEYNGLATNAYSVDGETVGQYTGQNDACAAEIFDKDILQDENGNVGMVFWNKKELAWMMNVPRYGNLWLASDSLSLRIVGNAHDNPEFLEKAAKTA